MTKDTSTCSTLTTNQTISDTMLQNAHGPIPYNMTNDYMFRAVLQSNNKVLRGLICSLLHLDESQVQSAEVTNPIILGDALTDKEIRLDIYVILNNQCMINLEMQVSNNLNWPSRSLLYLSRSYDNLNHGEEYADILPAVHIGFLDYTLFPEHPEFYATYKMMNVKNHHIYSGNFVLNVVDLSQIDMATEEDKKYHIDEWAKLFKATTWEEIAQMAKQNEYLQEASRSIFQFNADDQIRKMCRDRIEYHQDLRNYARHVADLESLLIHALLTQEKALLERDKALAEIAKKDIALAEKENALAEKNNALAEKDNTIALLLKQKETRET